MTNCLNFSLLTLEYQKFPSLFIIKTRFKNLLLLLSSKKSSAKEFVDQIATRYQPDNFGLAGRVSPRVIADQGECDGNQTLPNRNCVTKF